MKKILVVLDGASGLPIDLFKGKTAFEAAETINLDFFATKGKMGYMYPLNEKIVPGSDDSLVSIFGNSMKVGRGIFEAIGLGMDFRKGNLALRTNFGTIENIKNRKVVDRRAGRTLTSKESKILAKAINKHVKLSCKFEFKSGVQHRGALVLKGNFSDKISSSDPEWKHGKGNLFEFSKSLDDKEISEYTANVINDFLQQSFRILDNHFINHRRKHKGLLSANMLFLRGAEIEIPKLKKYNCWMSINSMPLEIGIAKISKMKNFGFVYPKLKEIDVYDNLYRGLEKSIKFAIKTIKKQYRNFEGCYIQLKETDMPGHDNKPYEKKKMIEIIDKKFFSFLRKFVKDKEIRLVVTCDHSTPCRLKSHSTDPVPVLVYDGKEKDDSQSFCEKQSKMGSLGKIYGREFMKKTGLDR